MLPLPPLERPIPEFSTEPNLENIFGELLSGTWATAADACDNRIAMTSPIPYPGGIPMLPSSSYYPLQDQHNFRNSVPVGIQNCSPLGTNYSNSLCPIISEVPDNLPVDGGHSEISGLSDLPQLDHPDSPLPEPPFIRRFPENRPTSAAKSDGKGQVNSEGADLETHSPLITGQVDSSWVNITRCSQRPEPYFIPQHQGVTLKRISGEIADFQPSENPGCARNRDIPNPSLTKLSPLSPLFHVRPSTEKSERPAKRQRRTERMTPPDLIHSSSRLFSGPSSQVDQMVIHECIQNGNQRQIVSMPVVDDTAIQRNLMVNDLEYQWKTATGDAAMKQSAAAVNFQTDTHGGRENAYNCFLKSANNPGGNQGPGSPDSIQTPSHKATNVNGAKTLTSKIFRYPLLPTEGTAVPSSLQGSGSKTREPMILKQAGNIATDVSMPARSDSHPLRSTPIIADKSKAKTNILGKVAVDCRNTIETSSDCGTFEVTTNNLGVSETSRPQLPKVSGTDLDSKEVQFSGEVAMEATEQLSKDLDPDEVVYDTHYILRRLENPPECNVCGKSYITEENLEKHMKTAHGAHETDTHKCNECKATFKNDTNLRRHIHEAHGTKTFFCDPCDAGFATKRALVLHQKKLHRVVPKSVQRKKAAKQSRASTSEKKVLIYFECLLCMYSTTVKGNLMRHVRGKHLNERPYECEHCGQRGKTKQNVAFHIQVCREKTRTLLMKARK